jgi:hypothetical protein
MQSEVTYCYRDGSNYKFFGQVVLDGEFSVSQIEKFLFHGEYFVPHEVDLDHLLVEPWNGDDHYLHEIVDVVPVSGRKAVCSADEFIERFRRAADRGWFSALSNMSA